MRDPVVGGEESGLEDFACVGAGEVSGFGDGVEDLTQGGGVDGQVVDGFVGRGGDVGGVASLGEHGEDGAGVGSGEGLSLVA